MKRLIHHPYPEDFKDNPLYQGIYNTAHMYGGNINWVTDGLGRKGKSRTNLRFGWDLDRDPVTFEERFSVDNVCFSFEEARKKVTSKLPVGTVVIWEEAGSVFGANARQWQSVVNQKASNLFQIVGRRQLIFLVNLPNFMMLDKQVRMLCHIRTTCYGVKKIGDDRGVYTKTKILSPHHYMYDSFSSPIYSSIKAFRMKSENTLVHDAPKYIVKAYLEKEKEWKDEMENKIGQGKIKVPEKPASLFNRALQLGMMNSEKIFDQSGNIDRGAVIEILRNDGLNLSSNYIRDVISTLRYQHTRKPYLDI